MSAASPPNGRTRVVVVDDHPGFRSAARTLLERRGYAVVGEAVCGATAVEAAERHAPEAVLLDVRLGTDDGVEVCRALTGTWPELAVLLVSDGLVEDAERLVASSGARGFVPKSRLARVDFREFWPAPERPLAGPGPGVSPCRRGTSAPP